MAPLESTKKQKVINSLYYPYHNESVMISTQSLLMAVLILVLTILSTTTVSFAQNKDKNTFEVIRPTRADLPDWLFDMIPDPGDRIGSFVYDINQNGVIVGSAAIEDRNNPDLFGHFLYRYKDGNFDFINTSHLGFFEIWEHVSMNNHGDIAFNRTTNNVYYSYLVNSENILTELPTSHRGYNDLSDDLWMITNSGGAYNPEAGYENVNALGYMNNNSVGAGFRSVGLDRYPVTWNPTDGLQIIDYLDIPESESGTVAINDNGDLMIASGDAPRNYYLALNEGDAYTLYDKVLDQSEDNTMGVYGFNDDLWIATGVRESYPWPIQIWTIETGLVPFIDLFPESVKYDIYQPIGLNNLGQLSGHVQWYEDGVLQGGTYIATINNIPEPAVFILLVLFIVFVFNRRGKCYSVL